MPLCPHLTITLIIQYNVISNYDVNCDFRFREVFIVRKVHASNLCELEQLTNTEICGPKFVNPETVGLISGVTREFQILLLPLRCSIYMFTVFVSMDDQFEAKNSRDVNFITLF